MMILQDSDPHHLHPDFSYFYLYLILAVVLGAAMLYGGVKLMRYLDNRAESKAAEKDESKTD